MNEAQHGRLLLLIFQDTYLTSHLRVDALQEMLTDLFNDAQEKTGWPGETMKSNNWREAVGREIGSTPWGQVVGDARPFIISPNDLELLTRENLLKSSRITPYTFKTIHPERHKSGIRV